MNMKLYVLIGVILLSQSCSAMERTANNLWSLAQLAAGAVGPNAQNTVEELKQYATARATEALGAHPAAIGRALEDATEIWGSSMESVANSKPLREEFAKAFMQEHPIILALKELLKENDEQGKNYRVSEDKLQRIAVLIHADKENKNRLSFAGTPCFHLACMLDDPTVARLFLENGVDAEATVQETKAYTTANTLKPLAIRFFAPERLRGAYNEAFESLKLRLGCNAVHAAASAGSVNVLKLLYARDFDINVPSRGLLPIHLAAANGHVEAFIFLATHGGLVNFPDPAGNTPLMIAYQQAYRAALAEAHKIDLLESVTELKKPLEEFRTWLETSKWAHLIVAISLAKFYAKGGDLTPEQIKASFFTNESIIKEQDVRDYILRKEQLPYHLLEPINRF